MQRHARRSRIVAAGLGVGALVALVTGMVATERVLPKALEKGDPGLSAADPFSAGGPATPPSVPPARRSLRTVTSAS